MYIHVSRKTREVPALKEEIRKGTITVSKAKRIVPVLNRGNQAHWLGLAKTLSKSKLEKQVALASPKTAVRDQIKFVNSRVQLQAGISEKLMLQIRRAQDVLSQKRRRSVTLEETFEAMTEMFLRNADPLERAKRQKMKGKLQEFERQAITAPPPDAAKPPAEATLQQGPGRERIPLDARTKHQVALKYNGQCAYIENSGKRCSNRRFVEIHHIKPVSEGGTNALENLKLLCSGHHRAEHVGSRPPDKFVARRAQLS